MRHLIALGTFVLLALPVTASAGPPYRADQVSQPHMPEPAAIAVFALGVAVVGGAIWRKKRRD